MVTPLKVELHIVAASQLPGMEELMERDLSITFGGGATWELFSREAILEEIKRHIHLGDAEQMAFNLRMTTLYEVISDLDSHIVIDMAS